MRFFGNNLAKNGQILTKFLPNICIISRSLSGFDPFWANFALWGVQKVPKIRFFGNYLVKICQIWPIFKWFKWFKCIKWYKFKGFIWFKLFCPFGLVWFGTKCGNVSALFFHLLKLCQVVYLDQLSGPSLVLVWSSQVLKSSCLFYSWPYGANSVCYPAIFSWLRPAL